MAGCFVDLSTKQWVFGSYHKLEPTGPPTADWWIDGWLGIQTSVNQGALFGMGQGKSTWFALLSCAALAGIIYWLFVRGGAWDRWLTGALGAISGGILGNLYDRLGLWHGMSRETWQGQPVPTHSVYGVRDWIHFRWEGSPLAIFDPWPNFNIADSLLVCGAIALFLHAVFAKGATGPPQASNDDDRSPTASSPQPNNDS